MNDQDHVIIRYERARQAVALIKEERRQLIWKCDNVKALANELCLVAASKSATEERHDHDHYDEHGLYAGDSYQDIMDNIGCPACRKSYAIKIGALADAKSEFGSAKRSLAAWGKKLIKQNGNQ